MSDNTTGTQPYATGQVSLPNGGQVLSTDTPDVSSSPNPATAPANQPAPPPQAQAPQAQAPQTQNPSQTATIPQKSMAPGPVANQAPQTSQSDLQNHPLNQKASLLSTVARTLAGNPVDVTIDKNGNEIRTPRPLSRGQIMGAIVLEALGGAAKGAASGTGPGAEGRAAAAGFEQGVQQQQAQAQKAEQISKEDFARHAQITETNMRLLNNAMQMGKMEQENNQSYVDSYKDLRDRLTTEFPAYIKAYSVPYSELSKYNATSETAIPAQVVARIGKDGQQARDANGKPLWDINYMIVDPSLKASGFFTDKDIATGKAWHLQNGAFNNPNLKDSPMNLLMALNQKAQLNSLEMIDDEFKNFYEKLNEDRGNTYTGLTEPTFTDPNIARAISDASAKYGVDPTFIAGIIEKESHGNAGVADNKNTNGTYDRGVMQVNSNTANMLGVSEDDLSDVEKNVDAGTRYLAMMLRKNAGDPMKAFAAYNGAGPAAEAYAKDVAGIIGLDKAKLVPMEKIDPIDLHAAAGVDSALVPALSQFQSYMNQAGGDYQKAIAAMGSSKDPATQQNANRVLAALGGGSGNGWKYIQQYENAKQLDILNARQQQQMANQNAQKITQMNEKNANAMAFADKQFGFHDAQTGTTIDPSKLQVPDNVYDYSLKDLENYYQNHGVKLPPDFAAAYEVAHYKTSMHDAFPTRVWAGSIGEADAQRAIGDMARAINPAFNASIYPDMANFRKKLDDPSVKQAGGMIQSASVAASHIDQLQQLAYAMDQANHHSNFQPFNALANRYHIAVGDTPANSYQAVATAVGQEVAKAVSGDKPAEDVVQDYIKSLNNKNALQQTLDVAKQYSHLMYSRVYNLNEQAQQKLGETLAGHGVGAEATRQWQQYGWDTPWATANNGQNVQPKANGQAASAQPFKPVAGQANLYPKISKDGTIGLGPDNKKYIIATGQLAPGQ